MSKSHGKTVNDFSWSAVSLAAVFLFVVWYATADYLQLDAFPTPLIVFKELPSFIVDENVWMALFASLGRMAVAYIIALVIAVTLGLAMGRSQRVYYFFYPIVSFFYPMPKAALMPILMLWFGLGDFSKVLVIALGVSLPLLFHSYIGALRVDQKMIWAAEAFGMGYWRRLFKIVLPAALPEIMIGCRVGIVMALIIMVSSEMIARQQGIGNVLFTALDMAHYSMVYLVILILAVIGVLLDWIFEQLRSFFSYH